MLARGLRSISILLSPGPQSSQTLKSRLRHARTIDAARSQLSRYAGHLKTLFAGVNQPKNRYNEAYKIKEKAGTGT